MNILVTGGAGFVGSHLCEQLLDQGNRVVCLDNLQTGVRENIAPVEDNKNFQFIEHDICDPIFLAEPIDQIYNLACPASPIGYQKDPIATLRTNTIGIINILELAREKKARILQTSTSEVYGDPTEHPQKETYRGNVNPVGIRACYDEGKRVAETLFFDYHRVHGVDIRVARIFNTYGPRMARDDGRVVSNFVVQALEGKDITVYGDGSQTRSLCYVDDMVKGLMVLMEGDTMGPINLGNPDERTVLEIANKIIALTKSKSQIIFQPLPQDDPRQRCPDISVAKKKLNWEPRIPVDEGLQKVIHFFSLQKK